MVWWCWYPGVAETTGIQRRGAESRKTQAAASCLCGRGRGRAGGRAGAARWPWRCRELADVKALRTALGAFSSVSCWYAGKPHLHYAAVHMPSDGRKGVLY